MGIDPVSLMAIGSIATSVIGAGMGAIGSVNQGKAASNAAQYQAAVARNNMAVADWQAQDALARGRVVEQNQRFKTSQIQGAQRAAAGASGVEVNTGSPAALVADTAMLGELDALTIRSNAERDAYGYKVQARNFGAQANIADNESRSAKRAGELGMYTSLIGGVTSVADKWLTFDSKGMFGTKKSSSTGPTLYPYGGT